MQGLAAGDGIDERRVAVRAAAAGLCATLVGIGLARFAYTPLIPALIEARWFTPSEAAYLGAANLAGYLGGALLAPWIVARIPAVRILRVSMVLASLTFLASAWPAPFAWFALWRFAAGVAGALLVVIAAPTVLPLVAPARRGLVGGVIFTGVGIGIAASGTLVPQLIRLGLEATWLGLGALALILTLAAWRGWPRPGQPAAGPAPVAKTRRTWPLPLKALLLVYGLNAVGLVPHMVFLADFVARGLHRGLEAGALTWVVFGLGAIAGPILTGHIADRIGFGPTIRLALVVQGLAVGILALTANPLALALSSLVVGALVPGIVPIVLGRSLELAPDDAVSRIAAWRLATTMFALGQAAGAYALSFLFATTHDYVLLFGIGAAAFGVALAIDLAAGARARIQLR